MLAIRLQRTGRKGHAMFRVVVQDSRRTPTSGNIVAQLGTYDPHSKVATLDNDKASFYLTNGAQPSPRVVSLLKNEGVKLPKWVAALDKKTSAVRNPEKLRRNRPAGAEPVVAEVPVTESEATAEATAPAENSAETADTAAAEAAVTTEEAPEA